MNKETIEYLEACRRVGMSDEAIRQQLSEAGWSTSAVDSALQVAETPSTPIQQVVPAPTPVSTFNPARVGANPQYAPSTSGSSVYEQLGVERREMESFSSVPVTVKIISIVGYLGSILLLLFGGLCILGSYLFSSIPDSVLSIIPLLSTLSEAGSIMFLSVGISFVGFAILFIFTSHGLWRGKNWARIFLVIVLSLWIAWSIFLIVQNQTIQNIVGPVIPLIVVLYLMMSHRVKEAFLTNEGLEGETKGFTLAFIALLVCVGIMVGGMIYGAMGVSSTLNDGINTLPPITLPPSEENPPPPIENATSSESVASTTPIVEPTQTPTPPPVIVAPPPKPPPKPAVPTSTEAWNVFVKYSNALQEYDQNALSKVMYNYSDAEYKACLKTSTGDECDTMVADAMDLAYEAIKNYTKASFVNFYQDSKQSVLATAPKIDGVGYRVEYLFFARDSAKVLRIVGGRSAAYATVAEAKDTDKDGRSDIDERCEGAAGIFPSCVKTDASVRDTDRDGWWDGIEAAMAK